jgi:5-formyltetrahydrofolate cyclo-ligase
MDGSAKQALRDTVIVARLRLSPEERAALSHAVAERVVVLDAFVRARTVALYAPMGAEVDTAEIARIGASLGKRLAYPRLLEGDRALGFAACHADALLPGALRTREPPPGAPAISPGEIDLVLVPGVAFDARGRRLGRGRGHYDATLAGLPASARRVGLAFELQIMSVIPQERHDALLDVIVTEARVIVPMPPAEAGDDGHH